MPRSGRINGESKNEFQARLVEAGKWREYVDERAELAVEEEITMRQAGERLRMSNKYAPTPEDMQKEPHPENPKALSNVYDTQVWIYENMGNDFIGIEEAPSPGAYYQLKELQAHSHLRCRFYETIIPKLMPSQRQVDAMQSLDDPNMSVFSRLDALERELT